MSIVNFKDISSYLLVFLDSESIILLVIVSRKNILVISKSSLYQEIVKIINLESMQIIFNNTINLLSKYDYIIGY
jgi:hypothetical protein